MVLGAHERDCVSKESLVGALVLALFAWGLNMALDRRSGGATGVLALLLYLVFELGLTCNPSGWWRGRST
jgi:hypothetical protein